MLESVRSSAGRFNYSIVWEFKIIEEDLLLILSGELDAVVDAEVSFVSPETAVDACCFEFAFSAAFFSVSSKAIFSSTLAVYCYSY